MGRVRGWRIFVRLLLTLVLCIGMVAAAEAYVITGTVTNNSGKSGRIFLMLFDNNWNSVGLGTSIPSAGAFTISGVPSGDYHLGAYVDVLNTGVYIAVGPNVSVPVSIAGSDVSNVQMAFGVKAAPTAQPLFNLSVMPGDGMVMMDWDVPTDSEGGYLAEKYDIYWGTSANPGPGGSTPSGSKLNVPFSSYTEAFISGLTNGQSLYFTVIPYLNSTLQTAAKVTSANPVTIGLPAGGSTVSGTITSPGSVSGPLYVALINDAMQQFYIKAISAPISSSQLFSISGVQPGNYQLVAFIDSNNDGVKLPPDIGETDSQTPYISVSSGYNVNYADLTIAPVNVPIEVGTGHHPNDFDPQNDFYSLNLKADWFDAARRIVGIRVSGPGITETIDMGLRADWEFEYSYQYHFPQGTKPVVGNQYTFQITYSDSETPVSLQVPIRTILDKVGAVPTIPSGNITNTQPLIGWRWPGPWQEGGYGYNVNVSGSSGWWDGETSMFQLYVPYNFNGEASSPALTVGQPYELNVSVGDPFNSWTARSVSVTPVSGGPNITSLSRTSGAPGTSVTIYGSGFSTTASNNLVYFNGYQAAVNSANASSLTVTVPSSVASGPITVTNTENSTTAISSTPFTALVTYSGKITDKNSGVLGSVSYYVEGVTPAISGTSDVNGNYSVAVPAGVPFTLRFSKATYLDTHSHLITLMNNSTSDYALYAAGDLPAITDGKGMLRSRVADHTSILHNLSGSALNLAGATVTATSLIHPDTPYSVTYNGGGTVTDSTGIYFVNNVDEGDVVTVKAAIAGYNFYPRTFGAHAGSVGQGRLRGSLIPSTSVSPSAGTYMAPMAVTLTANQPGTIYYTMDGSDPTRSGSSCGSNSTSYSWSCNLQLMNAGTTTVKYYTLNTFGISEPVKSTVYTVNVPDAEPPAISAFSVSSPVPGLTVPVTSFIANDNVLVTGYMITMTSTQPAANAVGWSGSVPTSIDLPPGTGSGTYSLYAWAKDAAGNVSGYAPAQVTVDIEYQLSLTVSGSGNGTVTGIGSPIAISINQGTNNYSIDQNSSFVLRTTVSPDSTFSGWSGACTGTATDCAVTMNGPKTVTATFAAKPARIKESGSKAAEYYFLDKALTDAATGNTLKVQQTEFVENASLVRNIALTIQGGYDSSFMTRTGYSTLSGVLTIANGSMIIDMLTIK